MKHNPLPKIIRIMPDYGPTYASVKRTAFFISRLIFDHHPNIEIIREIENHLHGLADWINSGEADENIDFPWGKHEAEVLQCTQE